MDIFYMLAGAFIFTLGMVTEHFVFYNVCKNCKHDKKQELYEKEFSEYEKNINRIKLEMENLDMQAEPPKSFLPDDMTKYEYTPILHEEQNVNQVEIITNEYEKEYEQRILKRR